MSKRFMVTGGAGFIGSHLCKRLLDDGNEVLCVDNLFTGSRKNIVELLKHPYFEFVRHDITFPLYVEVDAVFNLACPASPVHYSRDPIQTIKLCTTGMVNVLGLAKRLKVPVVQASTSEVYGDPKEHPQTESYWGHVNPIGIRSCYNEGKRAAEALCVAYHKQCNVPVKIARIFNTYGPRMALNDGRVVSNFVVQVLKGEKMTLYGDGSQTRSFCYVSDTVDALIRLMGTPPSFTGPVNIGNPKEVTMRELGDMVIEVTGRRIYDDPFVFEPLPADDPCRRKPDITLAKKVLDWEPVVGLHEGIYKTVDYFRGLLASERG